MHMACSHDVTPLSSSYSDRRRKTTMKTSCAASAMSASGTPKRRSVLSTKTRLVLTTSVTEGLVETCCGAAVGCNTYDESSMRRSLPRTGSWVPPRFGQIARRFVHRAYRDRRRARLVLAPNLLPILLRGHAGRVLECQREAV